MKYFSKYFLFSLLILLTVKINSQILESKKVTYSENTPIRQLAETYLGDPDLWNAILVFNNISDLAELQEGMILNIPTGLVQVTKKNLSETKKKIQQATENGAEIFAKASLESSITNILTAQEYIEKQQWEEAYSKIDTALEQAQIALAKARDMRNQMADATVSERVGDVEKRTLSTTQWKDAPLFTNLFEKDRARTLSKSLAEISFQDLSRFKLGENSQAVIQKSRIDLLKEQGTSAVKLIQGEAFAKLIQEPKDNFSLEIPGLSTKINSKLFWVEKEEDESKIANYDGEIELSARNRTVTVKSNQGSIVPANGTPSEPTSLLPSPVLLSPEDQKLFYKLPLQFRWNPVEKAREYWLQLINDPSGNEVLQTIKVITTNSFNLTSLKPGEYFWRISAIDQLGLPGKYSNSQSFIIVKDITPPFLTIESPGDNVVTDNKMLMVKGATEKNCIIEINSNIIELTPNDEFNTEVKLNEGENLITVNSTDASGNKSFVTRTVLYHPHGNTDFFLSGVKKSENKYETYTNQDHKVIKGRWKPNSQILIEYIGKKKNFRIFTDQQGSFSFTLEVPDKVNNYLLITDAPEKREEYQLNILKDKISPIIELVNLLEGYTSEAKLTLEGMVYDAEALTINGQAITFDDNSFSKTLTLTEGKNLITIIASDKAGNQTIKTGNMVLDTTPPKLIGYTFKKSTSLNSFEVFIQAEDNSETKIIATVDFDVDGKTIRKHIKKWKNENNYREVVFFNPPVQKEPVITKIIITDYLNNTSEITLND